METGHVNASNERTSVYACENEKLRLAVESCDVGDIEYLLSRGKCDVNIQSKGRPLILTALRKQCDDVVETLLRHGSKVDGVDEKGQPLLFCAVSNLKTGPLLSQFLEKCQELSPQLLTSKSVTSLSGKLPLHFAARHNPPAILPLITSGCDVTAQDIVHGDTALHVACFYGNLDAVVMLVQSGAQMNCLNNAGLTPLDRFLSLCHQPDKNSSARRRLLWAHTLTRMGFKVSQGAKGQGSRHKVLARYSMVKRCDECSSLQHLCRLLVRDMMSNVNLRHAMTSLEIAADLHDFLFFKPVAMDAHVTCSHTPRDL